MALKLHSAKITITNTQGNERITEQRLTHLQPPPPTPASRLLSMKPPSLFTQRRGAAGGAEPPARHMTSAARPRLVVLIGKAGDCLSGGSARQSLLRHKPTSDGFCLPPEVMEVQSLSFRSSFNGRPDAKVMTQSETMGVMYVAHTHTEKSIRRLSIQQQLQEGCCLPGRSSPGGDEQERPDGARPDGARMLTTGPRTLGRRNVPSAGRNCFSLAPVMSSEENDEPPVSAQNVRPQRACGAGEQEDLGDEGRRGGRAGGGVGGRVWEAGTLTLSAPWSRCLGRGLCVWRQMSSSASSCQVSDRGGAAAVQRLNSSVETRLTEG